MPVWLVTGGSGFVGRHLLTELRTKAAKDVAIIAVGRSCPIGWPAESLVRLDLEDQDAVSRLLDETRPTCLFHLAGRTPPGQFEDFDRLNRVLTSRLLGELVRLNHPCRVILAGSAAELGPVPVEDLPVGEDYPCRPIEPYGQSKWSATLAALAVKPPIEVVVARVFNPIGPGLPVAQALGRFASILAQGSGPVRLVVGDLSARRDFVDVRDVAAALLELALRGQAGQVYHVGTGQSHPVSGGLDRLIELSGREVTIEIDPTLARNRGPADSQADIRKIVGQVGWKPTISWDQSLVDLWSEAVARAHAGLTDPRPLV